MKAEVFRKLHEADWKAIAKELVAYAIWKAQNFAWRTGNHDNLARGFQAEDVAQEAIRRVLTDKRGWNPQRGKLLPYLKGVVDSLMSHLANSKDNSVQGRLKQDEEGKELLDPAEFHAERNDDFEFLSSHQKSRRANSDGASECVAKLFAAVEGDADLVAVLDVIMGSGETKPAEIAAELGIAVTEAYNRLKRLRHAALDIKRPPSSGHIASTRRTTSV